MRILVFFMTAVLLSGCDSIDTAEWQEEVLLHDGRMVVVSRKARRAHYGFPDSPRGRLIDERFYYEPLNIGWSTSDRAYDSRHDLVAFDIVNSEAYLVFQVSGKRFCKNKKDLDYSGIFLRWADGDWEEVEKEVLPIDSMLSNLSVSPWGRTVEEDYRGLVSWDQKKMIKIYPEGMKPRVLTVRDFFELRKKFCKRYNK